MKRFFTKLKSRKRQQKRQAKLITPDAVNSLLIFANENPAKLQDELQRLFPKARISFCYPRKDKNSSAPQGSYDYHAADVNLTGKIKSDKLQELLRASFDLVLDLSDKNLIGDFLFHQLQYGFSIGCSCCDQDEKHDLIIRGESNPESCMQAAKTQLTLLSQHEKK